MKTLYVAFDGKQFSDDKDCKDYEFKNKTLIDLSNIVKQCAMKSADVILEILLTNIEELRDIIFQPCACGKNGSLCIEPYDEEVNLIIRYEYLCKDCYGKSCREI